MKNSKIKTMGMLQVDIVGHSRLVKRTSADIAMEVKIYFAEQLKEKMEELGLKLAYWAGDGGLFAKECLQVSDYDSLVRAGEDTLSVISEVNFRFKTYFQAGEQIVIRVSAHMGQLYVMDNPQYWHGEELNFFAKYERLLSEPSMFSITESLRDCLSFHVRNKFPDTRSLEKFAGDRRIRVYFHSQYKPLNIVPARTSAILAPPTVPWIERILRTDPQQASYSIGNCVVFDQALSSEGYRPETLAISTLYDEYSLPNPLQPIVQKYSPKQIGTNLPHYRIAHFKHPETDFPSVEIGLARSWYKPVRGIQAALQDDPSQLVCTQKGEVTLVDYMLELEPLNFRKNLCPGNLGIHLAIVTAKEYMSSQGYDYEPNVVLVQRGPKEQVGYYPEAWSISIQEGMMAPGAMAGADARNSVDRSLFECAQRAIDEELLGMLIDQNRITFYCFFLEGDLFNPACFAIADVPVSFGELCRKRRRLAADVRESSFVAGVPLREEVLRKLFQSDELDFNYLKEVGKTDPESPCDPMNNTRTWHPAAKLSLFMIMRKYFPDSAREIACRLGYDKQ